MPAPESPNSIGINVADPAFGCRVSAGQDTPSSRNRYTGACLRPPRLLVSCGEPSGDFYGAELVRHLRATEPGLEVFGLGGDRLEAQGASLLAHTRDLAMVGITEVVRHIGRLHRLFGRVVSEIDRRRPDVAVLVDYPDFNLRLARQLKARGVPVVYYVSPQIWAWKSGRIRAIRDTVTRMLVIFPFEERHREARRDERETYDRDAEREDRPESRVGEDAPAPVDEPRREAEPPAGLVTDGNAAPGLLTLNVNPADASVYVDGRFVGSARQTGQLELRPGRHRVEVVRPGYRTAERDLTIEIGRMQTLSLDLARP